ncbi:uncharacterized protein LOC121726200 [Aricia agestis]|uniref:uncharacterized protein LOC121726200 n=1 Tax=Aricia agestis TaxID=91739 RepID=UPI001C2081DB|nr:uncharacterized protein LOC121726200 [Aricia agestis]
MTEEKDISTRTWARNVNSILKDGYSDGVIDGQNATYQSSFDMGYSQGLQFGLELGLKEAKRQQNGVPIPQLSDSRRINCQICIAGDIDRKNIGDLFNIQKEKNDEYLSKSAGL